MTGTLCFEGISVKRLAPWRGPRTPADSVIRQRVDVVRCGRSADCARVAGYSSRTGLGKVFRQSAQNLTKLAHVVKPQAIVWGKSLGAEIAALCERGDAIGGAIGQRLNGQSGLAAAGSHEAAAIAKK